MVMLDTNMILRYLLNDNPDMAEQAERYLDSGETTVTTEVIAEVVYVLKGVYGLERGAIADTLKDFLALVNCREEDVLRVALDAYATHSLDFVDCVLYGYHRVRHATVATFDKKLLKLMNH